MVQKEELQKQLRDNVMLVRFKKVDGSIRDMVCTLMDEYIGVVSHSNTSGPDHLVSVWDIEKDSWRSFKLSSLITFRPIAVSNLQVA